MRGDIGHGLHADAAREVVDHRCELWSDVVPFLDQLADAARSTRVDLCGRPGIGGGPADVAVEDVGAQAGEMSDHVVDRPLRTRRNRRVRGIVETFDELDDARASFFVQRAELAQVVRTPTSERCWRSHARTSYSLMPKSSTVELKRACVKPSGDAQSAA
jgi:hypothetical protein